MCCIGTCFAPLPPDRLLQCRENDACQQAYAAAAPDPDTSDFLLLGVPCICTALVSHAPGLDNGDTLAVHASALPSVI